MHFAFSQRLRHAFSLLLALSFFAQSQTLFAQFEEEKTTATDNAPRLDNALKQKLKVGIEVTASGGACKDIVASAAIPQEWDEQKVKLVDQKLSPNVKISFRKLKGGGATQVLVAIPSLAAGQSASAYLTYEITRYSLLPPKDTSKLKIPKIVPNEAQMYVSSASPGIEFRHTKIVALAKEIPADKKDWDRVEAIYDLIRSKVQYKEEGAFKGAVKALADGNGDCEDLSGLFIALCRQQNVPARIVWVKGHCYPEFYLVDDKKVGRWYPCQAAGARQFGGILDNNPIYQKGDNFFDPDRPGERLRYVSEFMKCVIAKGAAEPKLKATSEVLPAD